jgi:hypothetical protein
MLDECYPPSSSVTAAYFSGRKSSCVAAASFSGEKPPTTMVPTCDDNLINGFEQELS